MLRWESDDKVGLAVAFDRWDADRPQWTWSIDVAGEVLATASDLRGAATGEYSECEALRSLVSFLAAWAESGEDGENSDLFPASLRGFIGIDWQGLAEEAASSLGEVTS